jgi:hypothetical protein
MRDGLMLNGDTTDKETLMLFGGALLQAAVPDFDRYLKLRAM